MVQAPLVRLQQAPAGQGVAHVEPGLPAAPQQVTVAVISVQVVPTQQVLSATQGLRLVVEQEIPWPSQVLVPVQLAIGLNPEHDPVLEQQAPMQGLGVHEKEPLLLPPQVPLVQFADVVKEQPDRPAQQTTTQGLVGAHTVPSPM